MEVSPASRLETVLVLGVLAMTILGAAVAALVWGLGLASRASPFTSQVAVMGGVSAGVVATVFGYALLYRSAVSPDADELASRLVDVLHEALQSAVS